MIAVKDTKSVSFLKLEPFILTGLTNDFLLFDHILHSFCFCLARADKSVDFSPSHSIVRVHPPPTFAPPPRLLIGFKTSKWLTYFCFLLYICYCFSHLIGLLSVTWLSLLYKFTRFFIYFLFLSDEGPMLETLDNTIRIGSTPTILYFEVSLLCLRRTLRLYIYIYLQCFISHWSKWIYY